MYIELILNLSLLVAISVVSGFIVQRWPRDSRSGAIFQGILFGGAAVFGMLQPLVLGPGLIFDGRSVMLSICTLFFGPWAAIPSVLMSAGYRIWIGGVGVHMGVLVILASAGIGLIGYFRWRAREIPPSTLMLYVLGLAVHVVMLGLLFTLPDNIAVPALGHIGLPVILLYPLATILAGKILSDQQESFNYMKKLQASERKYGAMVETLPLAIILSSGTEEIIEYINPTMVKLFGYSKEDIPDVGKWWPLAYPDETYRSQISGKWTKRVKRAIETQSPVEPMETVVTCKDGAKKNVLWGFITIGEKNYSYGLDLTERKTAESHRDRQLYFAKALNGIAEVIIFKDNPDDILESVNRIIGETLQVDRTLIYDISFEQNHIIGLCEWLRSNHPNIAPTKDRYPLELFINSFTEIRKTRKYLESHFNEVSEHFIADGSGKILHEQMNIKSLIWYPFAFDEHGYCVFTLNQILERRQWTQDEIDFLESVAKQVTLALMKIRLIEERKLSDEEKARLENQFRQSQKMEAVGQLAGGISHDFNNLLSVINGYSQVLLMEPDLKTALREKVEEILRAGERAAGLTRQLLLFSRRQPMDFEIIDLNAIVSGMNKMLRRLIPESIDMELKNASDLWLIKSDPGHMEQVIMNLVINARDAMPVGGALTLETGNVEIDEANCICHHPDIKPGVYVMLSVSDTGCGMDASVKEHIFEPFFTTKEVGKGTGLGLATVYGIVKQSNAYIDVKSELGKGTRFRIYFPKAFD